ncbi:fas-binding factor 1 homolog [Rhynochetos jubatus]
MATKAKKSLKGSVDDLLHDLLGSDDESPVKSAGASQLAGGSRGRAWGTSSQASKKSFPEGDSFNRLPAEDVTRDEGSSACDVDPQALLQALKDMDDMEADLLGTSKSSSGLGKTAVKGPGRCDSSGGAVRNTGKLLAPEKGASVPAVEKQPLSSPPASQQYKKFNLEDSDDPLAGLLPEREQDAPKKPLPTGTEKKPAWSKEKEPPQTSLRTVAPVKKRVTFEDDGDDLLDAMGFGSGSKRDEKQGKKAEEEEVRPAELLGRSSVAKLLEQPGTGERREFKLGEKSQKQPEKEDGWHEEDFVFGTYQPTVASLPRARLMRRQPASGFSAENSSEPKLEPQSKPPPPASRSSVQSSRAGSDWLGLKDDFMELELSSPAKASPAGSHPRPSAARRPSPASQQPAAKEAATKPDPLEENCGACRSPTLGQWASEVLHRAWHGPAGITLVISLSQAMAVSQDVLEEIDRMKAAQSRMGEDIRTLQEVLGLVRLVAAGSAGINPSDAEAPVNSRAVTPKCGGCWEGGGIKIALGDRAPRHSPAQHPSGTCPGKSVDIPFKPHFGI